MNKQSILYKTLTRALHFKRPDGGAGVANFSDWLWCAIPKQHRAKAFVDPFNNIHIDARADKTNRTLFVAHVDTVHRQEGRNSIRKTPSAWYADGAPLGADDGAGCAMLMHLLCGGVPAYYIFTQGEECGGKGAKFLRDNYTSLLTQFDRAIAFDRRGIDSVISHQGWGRCCSDVFAQALADALNEEPALMYLPDDTGVYTDTAEFTELIPECTNISVGYDYEHSEREQLDLVHFTTLASRVLHIDWDALPTSRDPLAPDEEDLLGYGAKWSSKWSGLDGWGSKATSVNASSAYDDYLDGLGYADDGEDEIEYLRDLIYDAMAGHTRYLIEYVSEMVYPEDPALAARLLDKKLLTDEVLEEALKQAAAWDADYVACWIYDQCAVTA